jgi:lysozyme
MRRAMAVAAVLAAAACAGPPAHPNKKTEGHAPPTMGQRPPTGRVIRRLLRMSEGGLARLRRHEAFRAKVYDDGAANRTIGYGHMLHEGEAYPRGLSEAEARELFAKDVGEIVDPALKDLGIELNQNQIDALGSFIFNAGPGSFRRDVLPALKAKDFERAVAEMAQYTKGKNQRTGERMVLRGLVRRRREEIALFRMPMVTRALRGAALLCGLAALRMALSRRKRSESPEVG